MTNKKAAIDSMAAFFISFELVFQIKVYPFHSSQTQPAPLRNQR